MIVIVNICKMDHDISLVRILFKKNWDIFREIIFKIKILFWERREIGKILLSTIFLLWKNDGQIKYTILYSYIYKYDFIGSHKISQVLQSFWNWSNETPWKKKDTISNASL